MFLRFLLALPLLLSIASAHAIRINDHAFVAYGGNLADIDGTAANVFDALRHASHDPSLKGVGSLGDCTATELGTEGDYLWLLTAASCVPNTHLMQPVEMVFINFKGLATAGGPGGLSFVHPNRLHRPHGVLDTGTDIAMLRLKKLRGPASAAGGPYVNDIAAEAGVPVDFVSHGIPGYGPVGTVRRSMGALWPVSGERRTFGASVVERVVQDGHALTAGFAMGSPTHWAGVGPSDAGAPWIQWRHDLAGVRAVLLGTTTGGSAVQSQAVRVAKYAQWMNGLFPGTALISEAWQGPHDAWDIWHIGFRSAPFDPQVYFAVAPGQPWVSSRTEYNQATGKGHTWVRVPLTEVRTGRKSEVEFRAMRTGCRLPIDHRTPCGTHAMLEVDQTWRHQLPSGQWQGRLKMEAHHPTAGRLETIDVPINFGIHDSRGAAIRVQQTPRSWFYQAYWTEKTAAVYFTVPAQPGNPQGPANGYVNARTGHTRLTLEAREAVTQSTVSITLRASRRNGCGEFPMNNAVVCPGGPPVNWLHVWYEPSDNAALAPGRYQASLALSGRNWRDPTYRANTPIDIDIDLLP